MTRIGQEREIFVKSSSPSSPLPVERPGRHPQDPLGEPGPRQPVHARQRRLRQRGRLLPRRPLGVGSDAVAAAAAAAVAGVPLDEGEVGDGVGVVLAVRPLQHARHAVAQVEVLRRNVARQSQLRKLRLRKYLAHTEGKCGHSCIIRKFRRTHFVKRIFRRLVGERSPDPDGALPVVVQQFAVSLTPEK